MGSKIIFILRFLFKKDQISQISENTWKPEPNQFLSKLTFSCWFSTFSSSNFTFRYRWLLKRNHVSLTFLLCVLVSSSPGVLSWCFPRILCLSTSFLFDNRERVKEMGGVTDGGGVNLEVRVSFGLYYGQNECKSRSGAENRGMRLMQPQIFVETRTGVFLGVFPGLQCTWRKKGKVQGTFYPKPVKTDT